MNVRLNLEVRHVGSRPSRLPQASARHQRNLELDQLESWGVEPGTGNLETPVTSDPADLTPFEPDDRIGCPLRLRIALTTNSLGDQYGGAHIQVIRSMSIRRLRFVGSGSRHPLTATSEWPSSRYQDLSATIRTPSISACKGQDYRFFSHRGCLPS